MLVCQRVTIRNTMNFCYLCYALAWSTHITRGGHPLSITGKTWKIPDLNDIEIALNIMVINMYRIYIYICTYFILFYNIYICVCVFYQWHLWNNIIRNSPSTRNRQSSGRFRKGPRVTDRHGRGRRSAHRRSRWAPGSSRGPCPWKIMVMTCDDYMLI